MLIFFYRERVTTGAIRAHAGSSAQLRVSVFQARRCSSGGSKVKTEARDRDPNVLQLPAPPRLTYSDPDSYAVMPRRSPGVEITIAAAAIAAAVHGRTEG